MLVADTLGLSERDVETVLAYWPSDLPTDSDNTRSNGGSPRRDNDPRPAFRGSGVVLIAIGTFRSSCALVRDGRVVTAAVEGLHRYRGAGGLRGARR
jgi:hypothetical protein